jgi:hypothetical protein
MAKMRKGRAHESHTFTVMGLLPHLSYEDAEAERSKAHKRQQEREV